MGSVIAIIKRCPYATDRSPTFCVGRVHGLSGSHRGVVLLEFPAPQLQSPELGLRLRDLLLKGLLYRPLPHRSEDPSTAPNAAPGALDGEPCNCVIASRPPDTPPSAAAAVTGCCCLLAAATAGRPGGIPGGRGAFPSPERCSASHYCHPGPWLWRWRAPSNRRCFNGIMRLELPWNT